MNHLKKTRWHYYRFFSEYTSISAVIIYKIILLILFLSEGQAGEELETSSTAMLFRSYEALQIIIFHIVSMQGDNEDSKFIKKGRIC